MNKSQIFVVLASIILFLGLYFGFSTKNQHQKTTEQSRAITAESTGFDQILDDARAHLTPEQTNQETDLQKALSQADDASKAKYLKELSALWYQFGDPAVAGGFAEQVAEIEDTDAAWSIAGALFFEALSKSKDEIMRKYCGNHAVKSFESAASLNPKNVEHRVNLALTYAENPAPDDPMRAVMMLRDLEEKFPSEPSVYNALGRLAIKTNQWDRAIARLEKSWSLDQKNRNTPCLLAKAYEGAGNTIKSAEFAALCGQ
jgi:tetratricopeptide (TPR) repeat protein